MTIPPHQEAGDVDYQIVLPQVDDQARYEAHGYPAPDTLQGLKERLEVEARLIPPEAIQGSVELAFFAKEDGTPVTEAIYQQMLKSDQLIRLNACFPTKQLVMADRENKRLAREIEELRSSKRAKGCAQGVN